MFQELRTQTRWSISENFRDTRSLGEGGFGLNEAQPWTSTLILEGLKWPHLQMEKQRLRQGLSQPSLRLWDSPGYAMTAS